MTFFRTTVVGCLGALALSIGTGACGDDMGDHPEFAQAMAVKVEKVDGFPVVFHYGQARPDFNESGDNPLRERIPLDGTWKFRFDPQGVGERDGWNANATDEESWTQEKIPHCWDMMTGGRFWDWSDSSTANPPHYNGAGWYRYELMHRQAPGKRHRLEFLGVAQRAKIYLNGEEIAKHEGGGQPFSIDVTGKLREGMNQLALKVVRLPNYRKKPDNGFDEIRYVHTAHPKAPDNWPYAGILRKVSLIVENPVSIRKMLVREVKGKLEVAVVVSNHGDAECNLDLTVSGKALQQPLTQAGVKVPAGKVRVVQLNGPLVRDFAKWSPEKPVLHEFLCRISSDGKPVDQLRQNIGLRGFGIRDSRFILNDRPVFLKGVSVYEETPAKGGALHDADHFGIFRACRDSGANFLRFQVSQRAPIAYQLADRGGMMVTGEWGGFWYEEKAMAAQIADPQSLYLSLGRCAVWDLINHASVVLWCVHNESHQFCPEYEPFVKAARELVHEIDWQKRPVTWAAWHPNKGEPCFQHADAVGFNEYRGAMDPFEELDPDLTKAKLDSPGKPLIILENGAWSTLGVRGGKERQGTEDWQADLLRRQHEVLVKHTPPLSGYTYWLLADYRTRKEYTANRKADGYSRMGLYDENLRPKIVRDVFRNLAWPLK